MHQRNEPDIRKINEIMQEIEKELKAEEEEKAQSFATRTEAIFYPDRQRRGLTKR